MAELFVYGTLRTPIGGPAGDTHHHHRLVPFITARRPGRLSGAVLYDLGAYPGLGPGAGTVVGELFELSDGGLAKADVIEDHPEFYERRVERITLVDGAEVGAWVYWAPPEILIGREQIKGGDWFDRPRASISTPALPWPEDRTE